MLKKQVFMRLKVMRINNLLWILLFSLAILSCGKKNAADARMINNDLNMDTLFLGLTFGMTSQEFFDTSAVYNSRKLIVNEGLGGKSILYNTRDGELEYPALMSYYPVFTNDKISSMPVSFQYKQWAPWNKKFWTDSLIEDVRRLFESWYGDGFEGKKDVFGRMRYVKIDGPRVITLQCQDDHVVNATIENKELMRSDK